MINLETNNWKISNISGIIFDKDGTIIDSHIYWGRIIERRALGLINKYSLDSSFFKSLCYSMGYSIDSKKLRPEGPIALVSREKVIEKVMDELSQKNIKAESSIISEIFLSEHKIFADIEIFNFIKIIPGVREFIDKLKEEKIILSLVTSDSLASTNEILKYLKLDNGIFDCVIGKESTTEDKYSGVPAELAILNMKTLKAETISIGDAPVDVIMAHNSGIKAGIAVASGQVPFQVLVKHTNYVCNSCFDIKIVINK